MILQKIPVMDGSFLFVSLSIAGPFPNVKAKTNGTQDYAKVDDNFVLSLKKNFFKKMLSLSYRVYILTYNEMLTKNYVCFGEERELIERPLQRGVSSSVL
jgi:hypothetical protein